MKFLALADLHYNNYVWKDGYFQSLLKDTIEKYQIDVVLIAGDVVESSIIKHYNPYEVIRHNIFKDVDVPIIFCLGNHEFSYNSVDNVFERMTSFTDTYDCYCLDVNGHYDVNSDIRIVGNVLWYDNTLKGISTQPDNVIIDGWLDSTILDFIPSVNCFITEKSCISHVGPLEEYIILPKIGIFLINILTAPIIFPFSSSAKTTSFFQFDFTFAHSGDC